MQNCALVQLTDLKASFRMAGGAGAGDQWVPFQAAAAGCSRVDATVRQNVADGQDRPMLAREYMKAGASCRAGSPIAAGADQCVLSQVSAAPFAVTAAQKRGLAEETPLIVSAVGYRICTAFPAG